VDQALPKTPASPLFTGFLLFTPQRWLAAFGIASLVFAVTAKLTSSNTSVTVALAIFTDSTRHDSLCTYVRQEYIKEQDTT
jgi:hypothetical protein